MRSLLLGLVLLLVVGCAGRTTLQTTAEDPTRIDIAQLWVDPQDLESRDLFHGAGGAALAPAAGAAYELLAVDDSGYSAGYDVRDRGGTEWSVKLGPEAQSELVASRLLWVIGYHQPANYVLTQWTLTGEPGGHQGLARFRREPPAAKVVADWSWYENPFVTTQPFRGLVVANLILNNWDWKPSNNKIYDVQLQGGGGRRMYVVRDLGASLGKTSFPTFLSWTPLRAMKQGSRNDIDDFEEQGFIKGFDGGEIEFDYRGANPRLVDVLTVEDVLWTCRLMARISDAQWRDAFRAAGYDGAERDRYIAKLKQKIEEGLALGRLPAD